MDASLQRRPAAIPHRVLVPANAGPDPGSRTSLRTSLAQGIWLGLLGAWLELGVVLGHRRLVGQVTDVSRRLHWFHVPLGVIAHLALFIGWFALAVLIRRRQPLSSRRDLVSTILAWYLAVLSPLLAIEEFYWPCTT